MVRPPYPEAVRLYYIASEHWEHLEADYPQVDLMRLPVRKFLNVVMRWAMGQIEPKDREEWRRKMAEPFGQAVEGKRQPTNAELQADRDAFMSAMGG